MSDQPDLPHVELGVSVVLPSEMGTPSGLALSAAQTARLIIEQVRQSSPSGKIELDLLLVSDSGIRSLNLRHRGLDQPTDVLSFPLLEGPRDELLDDVTDDGPPIHLGDIVISLETVARQAGERELSMTERFAECLIHGILHLLGYEHDTEEKREEMEAIEDMVICQAVEIFTI